MFEYMCKLLFAIGLGFLMLLLCWPVGLAMIFVAPLLALKRES